MGDVRLVVVDRGERSEKRKEARGRVFLDMAQGRTPNFRDMAEARGVVVHEREESILSDAWIPLALVFLLVGFITGRDVAMLSLGFVLLLIYGVSSWWKANALAGVTYERELDHNHVFPGEPIRLSLRVDNHKPLPLTWLSFSDRLPVAPVEKGRVAEAIGDARGQYQLEHIFSISGNSGLERHYTLAFPRRGYYTVGPVRYRSGDIFTLFMVEREHDYRERIVVYPQVYPLEALGLPAKEPFGELKVQRSLFTDPIKTQGIRDYHPRDRFRDIHWKASARRGSLQTKVYDPSTGMTLAIFLNVATMRRHWMGFVPEQLERAISVAASVLNYGAEQKWAIGLYVNGSVPRSDQPIRVPPGRSPDHLSHVLEALAATTEFATGAIENLMQRESPRLPWAATLVLVTAHTGPEIGAVLLRLKEAGRRVALISLDEELPPTLPGILTYHIPPGAPEAAADTGSDVARSRSEASLAAVPAPPAVPTFEPS